MTSTELSTSPDSAPVVVDDPTREPTREPTSEPPVQQGNDSEGAQGSQGSTEAAAPEALLQRHKTRSLAPLRLAGHSRTVAGARGLLIRLARTINDGYLQVHDVDGTVHGFGDAGAPEELQVTISIHDEQAWVATALEGSIGFGRGYIEGWWHTADLTAAVRLLIRNLGPLDQFRNRLNRYTGPLGDAARRALPRTSKKRNREDIGAHYDLSNEFFSIFLDDTMTYSSGIFRVTDELGSAEDGTALALASLAKYDRLLDKLDVTDEHHVLEIGTGWGGLALRAAEQRGAKVTTTTVSTRQLAEAQTRTALSPAGSRINLLNSDWRDLTGTYDRLISIEMIEAVDWRDYDRFFATIERCLADDGMVGLQAICVPDQRYQRAKNTEDFIRRFIFPGGFLPSIGAIAESVARATQLQMLHVEDFSAHYAETLRRWRLRFDSRLEDVAALGLDERFQRLWRFYLAYCEAAFTERSCTVNQFVLVGPQWRPNGLELIGR